jgi:hypothetical protein
MSTKLFFGKSEGKRSFLGPRRRYEDNNKIYLMELGMEGVD